MTACTRRSAGLLLACLLLAACAPAHNVRPHPEFVTTAIERKDPSGRPYYWIDDIDMTPTGEPDGDHTATAEGFVSITPLHTNLTHESSLPGLASLIEGLS